MRLAAGVGTAICAVLLLLISAFTLRTQDDEPKLDRAIWSAYLDRFFQSGRIVDTDNQGISHSESQGYGLLLAEAFDDRQSFDAILAWTRSNLMRGDGLLSWRWEPDSGVTDANNATDGDILVAWALLRASNRWEAAEYRALAVAHLEAIEMHLLFDYRQQVLLLPGLDGFVRPDRYIVNPSYWVFPALDAFAELRPDEPWKEVITSGEWLLQSTTNGPVGLTSDWVEVSQSRVKPAVEFPSRFSWDAIRVPLYLAWGKPREELLQPFRSNWAARFENETLPAWIDTADGSQADYPAPAGIMAIANVLNGQCLTQDPAVAVSDSYYSSTLYLLSLLAATDAGLICQVD